MRNLKILSVIITFFLIVMSCKSDNNAIDTNADQAPFSTIFKDKRYENGFFVGSTNEANPNVVGKLNYGGTVTTTPVWRIGQWNCINNDLMKAVYSFVNNQFEYKVGTNGNRIAVNKTDGTLTLEINASTEYGLNRITSNPRKANEPWPTLLCEYKLPDTEILKISDKKEIHMDIDYKVLKLEDKMPAGTTNPALHSATFQWYITVQNRNTLSTEYGQYLWFGLCFHDKRYDFAPSYAAQDGGKENNTGMFIYIPDMKQIMSTQGKAEIGKKFSVDFDVLPILREAFTLAQKRNFLTKTKWEDLYVGATNIGWEVTGTYDVSVEINQFDIKYK